MPCCKAVYGGRLWRPVLILEFARLVQQSLGASALFLSYVFIIIKYNNSIRLDFLLLIKRMIAPTIQSFRLQKLWRCVLTSTLVLQSIRTV
jgi:hypothetical protein